MEEQRLKKVVSILKAGDSARVDFAQTRDTLLAQGFSDSEIINGVYRFTYDGKPNKPRLPDPIKSFYEQNPETADKSAKILLNNLAAEERQKLTLNTAASAFGDTHSRSFYEYKVAEHIGFPYFTMLLLAIVIGVAAIKYEWLSPAVYVVSIASSLYFSFLWYRKWSSTRKRK